MKFVTVALSIVVLTNQIHPGFRAQNSSAANSWDFTKNWKIYELANFQQIFKIAADSLQYLQRLPLNDDSVHFYLSNSTRLLNTAPVWMGCYLASCESSDGKIKKVIISHYAGFFYFQSEHAYFQVTSANTQAWQGYLSNAYMVLQNKEKNASK